MGSVLALDNSGSHWLKYRSPRFHVEELEVVLADGSVLRLGHKQNIETLCAVPVKRIIRSHRCTNGSPRSNPKSSPEYSQHS